MAEGVVDVAEVVQAQHHDGEVPVAEPLVQLGRQPLPERCLVRQTGERVLQRDAVTLECGHGAAVHGQDRHHQQRDEPQGVVGDGDDERGHRDDDAVDRQLEGQVVQQRGHEPAALVQREGDAGEHVVEDEEQRAGGEGGLETARLTQQPGPGRAEQVDQAAGCRQRQDVLRHVERHLPPRHPGPQLSEHGGERLHGHDQGPVDEQQQRARERARQRDAVDATAARERDRPQLRRDEEQREQDHGAVDVGAVAGRPEEERAQQHRDAGQRDGPDVAPEHRGEPERPGRGGQGGQLNLRPRFSEARGECSELWPASGAVSLLAWADGP